MSILYVTQPDAVYPRSQPPGWERVPRGSASCQERGGGASENGFPAWRLGTSWGKGCILT